jgi:ABC-type uncharacterized transport system ATPase subunit
LRKRLKDYQKLQEDIEYLKFRLETEEFELKRCKNEEIEYFSILKEVESIEIKEKITKITKELNVKNKQVEKINDLILKFDGLDNKILSLKYLEGMTLEMIANELNYTIGYIQKKHAAIIKIIRFVE